ncbi:hypothetical protein [Aestuariispira insulae]|uniref:Uncharacterized protein n=1 Tax=Aestuariispira insulae TaxID=1461337 RepID=A0A3D9HGL7_9PROT|nr:hypothetical protein [Aestuariispira insulae]RED48627.1 hypothetical protein DFP90_107131 [Aestuariispira insulae]
MSRKLDARLQGHGTKFRLHAQPPFLEGYEIPETVWLSPPPGSIQPGPSDHRMYVIDPKEKKDFYEDPFSLPFKGPAHPPAPPCPQGHFDHHGQDSREFRAAHMYGTVRRVLDIWEDYFRGPIPWHFRQTHDRLEMIPWLDWNNAQFGWAFMEAGYGRDGQGNRHAYALNFDVLAHEAGHGLVFSMVGIPSERNITAEYRGFHESASDLVAVLSVLHFEKFLDRLLRKTAGNLYLENMLNRVGELSQTEEIRLASNAYRMRDCIDVRTPVEELSYKQVHSLGEPLTGAFFDILVEIYQNNLVRLGAIPAELNRDSTRNSKLALAGDRLHKQYQDCYAQSPDLFRQALEIARDALGYRLAECWRQLRADHLTYGGVAKTFLTIDRRLSGNCYQNAIIESFRWREIGFGYPRSRKAHEAH